MFEFELKKKRLENEKEFDVARIEELEENNKQMLDDIQDLTKGKIETEIRFAGEEKKNEDLFGLLRNTQEKVDELEGNKLYNMSKLLETEKLLTAKLEFELADLKK